MGKNIRASLLLVILVTVLFIPLTLQIRGIFHNDQAMSESLRHWFFAYNLQKGIFPLWNPHVWCGASPSYTFVYSGKYYYFLIFFWPFYLFANLFNIDQSYLFIFLFPLFIHYLLAVIGMFLLLRKAIKCSIFSSFIGALLYVFSSAFSYAYVSENSLMLQAWFPWLIYVYLTALKSKKQIYVFLGSIILFNMWVVGKPYYMIFAFIIWSGFIVVELRSGISSKNRENIFLPLRVAAQIFIFGTFLSAVYLYPLINSFHYVRLGENTNPNFIMNFKPVILSFPYLITLLIPGFFGNITGINFIFRPLMFWRANMSGGMAISLFIFITILLAIAKKRHIHRYTKLGIFLYIFSILCALGSNSVFYKIFIVKIPIINNIPYPILYRFIQCFAVSLIVALGIDYIVIFIKDTRFVRNIYKLINYYIAFSFFVVLLLLFLPLDFLKDYSFNINSTNSTNHAMFICKDPVGIYTSRFSKLNEIKVMFSGNSAGDIRYSDRHFVSCDSGKLITKYKVKARGWLKVKVNVPPNKFLWICPKKGAGGIVIKEGAGHIIFIYKHNHWIVKANSISVLPIYEKHNKNFTLFNGIIDKSIETKPIIHSLLYWIIAIFLIIVAKKMFRIKYFVYTMGIFAVLESFVFFLMAFYGCTFNEFPNKARAFLPHNIRSITPSAHPMVKTYMNFSKIIKNSHFFRFATSYPFYDNFVYFNNKYSLMGEPALQLEKRFKRAFEESYGSPIDLSMYYEGGGVFPEKINFLNNFSVKYFLSDSCQPLFIQDENTPLYSDYDLYLHINKDALPRVYTIDNVDVVSDEKQLQFLVNDDLRKSAYVASEDILRYLPNKNISNSYDYIAHFNYIQKKNSIKRADFSDPNSIKLGIDIKIPSLLVITDVWYPGWKAWIDGKKTKIYRVNYCQRGIILNKGYHKVYLSFMPLDWYIGLFVSLAAFAIMTFLLVVEFL